MVNEQFLRKKGIKLLKLKRMFKKSNLYGLWIPNENTSDTYNLIYEHLKKKEKYHIVNLEDLTNGRFNKEENIFFADSSINEEDKILKRKQIKGEIINAIRYYYNDKEKIIFLSKSINELKSIIKNKSHIQVIRNELKKSNEIEDYIHLPYKVIEYDREEKLKVNLDLNY